LTKVFYLYICVFNLHVILPSWCFLLTYVFSTIFCDTFVFVENSLWHVRFFPIAINLTFVCVSTCRHTSAFISGSFSSSLFLSVGIETRGKWRQKVYGLRMKSIMLKTGTHTYTLTHTHAHMHTKCPATLTGGKVAKLNQFSSAYQLENMQIFDTG